MCTLCMVFCCNIDCNDGRTEAAVAVGVIRPVETPQTGLTKQFVGAP